MRFHNLRPPTAIHYAPVADYEVILRVRCARGNGNEPEKHDKTGDEEKQPEGSDELHLAMCSRPVLRGRAPLPAAYNGSANTKDEAWG